MKKFAVWFDIKKDKQVYGHEIIVFASNAKEARRLAEEKWYAHHIEHMFHVSVHRIKEA